MAKHNDLGKWGEDEATTFLEMKGYVVCDRNWKEGHRDLDIVAVSEDRQTLVIVEVKTRQSEELTEPEDAVNRSKMRNLAIAADAYVKAHGIKQKIRFDIISIVGTKDNVQRTTHFIDAFNPMLVI